MEGQIVSIRQRKMASGRISLYLAFSVNGKRYYEYPKLYLLPETGKGKQKATIANKETMRLMEALRAKRIVEIAEGRVCLEKKQKKADRLLTEYLSEFKEWKLYTTNKDEYNRVCDATLKHLIAYKGDKVLLRKIDVKYCEGFADYLSHCVSARKRPLSKATQTNYYNILAALLDKAQKDDIIAKNPVRQVDHNLRPTPPESQRVYLDIAEVKALAQCEEIRYSIVKYAFLFSCFTGLRISDIRRLTWNDLSSVTDDKGNSVCRLSLRMKKTQRIISFPLSAEARSWLPPRSNKPEVFHNLPSYTTIHYDIHDWTRAAGIKKNVTFHVARHNKIFY